MKRAVEEAPDLVLPLDLLACLLWCTPVLARTCKCLATQFSDSALITHYRRRAIACTWPVEGSGVWAPFNWDRYINSAMTDCWGASFRGGGSVHIYNYDRHVSSLKRTDIRFSIRSAVKIPSHEHKTLACLLLKIDDGHDWFKVRVRIDDPDTDAPMISIVVETTGGAIHDTAMTVHNNDSVDFDYVLGYAQFLAAHPRELVNFATCGVVFPNPAMTPQEFPLMDTPQSVAFFHGLL